MKRHDRRVLTNCVLFGALVTAAVVVMDFSGLLTPAENWMYDQRARHFQFFAPPPTDQLIHLDIDDKALDGIGRWPWPRTIEAQIIDELHLAGAKAIGMDILFADPQHPEFQPTIAPDGSQKFVEVDHDANLAAAVKRAGNVILPASFTLDLPTHNPLYDAVLKALVDDIELTEREVSDRIHGQFAREATKEGALTNVFLSARREAVYRRVVRELANSKIEPDQLRLKLVKKQDASLTSPLTHLIDEQFDRYEAITRLEHFGAQPAKGVADFVPASVNLPVINPLSHVMASTAFVDFTFTLSRDGVLRTQPLIIQSQGKLYPQMGLALALQYLNARTSDLTIGAESITINHPGGETITLPTIRYLSESLGRSVPTIFNIPWFGGKHWETMYDWPTHTEAVQHQSINTAADIGLTQKRIVENIAKVDGAAVNIAEALGFIGEDNHLDFSIPKSLAADDAVARSALCARFLANAAKCGVDYTPKKEDLGAWALVRAIDAMKNFDRERIRLNDQLVNQRQALRRAVNGKAVLIGWTATGHQDAVPTSLHSQCPGVVAHGAIFNAIITRHFWTVAPRWITIALTIALGIITAAIAWRFSPLGAFLITSVFGMGYVALNGLYFFDHLNLIVGLAAPQVAMGGVWAGCSLGRIVIEQAERARVTRRLGSYTDPRLVSYVLEKEDDHLLEGETRELTVCFSDMAGFTSLSEKLGQNIVPILNEYLTLMVPIIRAQGGYVNKFLGDGIMYFFGAPYPTDRHAEQAVETALLMQQAIVEFNKSLLARGLPTVKVRIGIHTGEMVVGDAGAHDAADYTVLGDNVNFASRLESGNKQLGTLILMSARTAELAGDRFLLRPIGVLQVVGKTEGVMTYSLTGYTADADAKSRRLVELTKTMVDAFREKDFVTASGAAGALDAEFGESILPGLYRNLCKFYVDNPPADPFDGKIVFTEK